MSWTAAQTAAGTPRQVQRDKCDGRCQEPRLSYSAAQPLAADRRIHRAGDGGGRHRLDARRDLGQMGVLPWPGGRSEEHTSELQSLMRISYAVFCLKKQTNKRI